MRIIIKFTENNTLVPINNQSDINYYIHKCLGNNNNYHDSKNDYSISNLQGGKINEDKKHLNFENGGFIAITSKNELFLDSLIGGILDNPVLKWGMEYTHIEFIKEDFIDGWNHFATLCPFIIKKYSDKKTYTFATIKDSDFHDILKNHLINKLTKTYDNIDLTNFDVEIKNHISHKTKCVMVKNVKNIANQCHVSIFCKKNIAEKIYNLGIGQSTGSGFGTIYKTENHNKYRLGLKK